MIEKRVKLKNKSFTIKIELKNIIKRRVLKSSTSDYTCDVWINDKKSITYRDLIFFNITNLNELYEKVIEKIRRT